MSKPNLPLIQYDDKRAESYSHHNLTYLHDVLDQKELTYTVVETNTNPKVIMVKYPVKYPEISLLYDNTLTLNYDTKEPIKRLFQDSQIRILLSNHEPHTGIEFTLGIDSYISPNFAVSRVNNQNLLRSLPNARNTNLALLTDEQKRGKVIATYRSDRTEVKESANILLETRDKLVVFPTNHDLLNDLPELDLAITWVSSVSGYMAPYLYEDHGINIAFGPIYGQVNVFTYNGENQKTFYLSYERGLNGHLVGRVVRTPFIPFREEPQTINGIPEEIEQDLDTRRVYYVRYYDRLEARPEVPRRFG